MKIMTKEEELAELEFLIKDEVEAIDGYKKALAQMSPLNPNFQILTHIMKEEEEHIVELNGCKANLTGGSYNYPPEPKED